MPPKDFCFSLPPCHRVILNQCVFQNASSKGGSDSISKLIWHNLYDTLAKHLTTPETVVLLLTTWWLRCSQSSGSKSSTLSRILVLKTSSKSVYRPLVLVPTWYRYEEQPSWPVVSVRPFFSSWLEPCFNYLLRKSKDCESLKSVRVIIEEKPKTN